MIPTRNLRVGNIRTPSRASAESSRSPPSPCRPAAWPSGTLVTVQDDPASDDDQVVAIAPDGSASHVVAYGSPLSSVSMANDGTIYIASDDQYTTDDDHMWTFAQNGSLLKPWKVPNAGQGELYGGPRQRADERATAALFNIAVVGPDGPGYATSTRAARAPRRAMSTTPAPVWSAPTTP